MIHNRMSAGRVYPVEKLDEGAFSGAGLAHENEHGGTRGRLGGRLGRLGAPDPLGERVAINKEPQRGRLGVLDPLGERVAVNEDTQQEKPDEAETADTPCPRRPPLRYWAGGQDWGGRGRFWVRRSWFDFDRHFEDGGIDVRLDFLAVIEGNWHGGDKNIEAVARQNPAILYYDISQILKHSLATGYWLGVA